MNEIKKSAPAFRISHQGEKLPKREPAAAGAELLTDINAARLQLASKIIDSNDCGEEERVAEYSSLDELLFRCECALTRLSERCDAGWQPIETAPKAGTFLVYLPDEYRKLQVMYRNERGITVIGGAFGFDLTKPTLWKPIEPPSDVLVSGSTEGGNG